MLLESLTIQYCGELEHIVVDIEDGSGGNELDINVFPKLKQLNVEECKKLKYIFGRINDNDQNNNEIQLHLPELKSLKLSSLPSLIGICPKQYHTTFSPLKVLKFDCCSLDDVKSIGDFTFLTSISRYQDNTTVKQFSGNIEHFLALESLEVSRSNVETILCLNEKSEPEINLGLQNIILRKLPMMIYPFVGPKNAFALKHLKSIVISQCEKLEIVFSTSVLRCLSQLSHLIIQDCNELKHIIEEEDDDIENAMSSKTCFPVLKILVVSNCNKLKSVFPISMSKELPELKAMLIWDAYELVEIFKSVGDDDHKVEIPNLKVVAFVNLPNLCHLQGIQGVRNHLVQNCKKLSLTSSGDFGSDVYDTDVIEADVLQLLTCLKYRMTSSQLEGSMSTIPETRNVPPIHSVDLKQKGIQVSVEEGTASTSYANTITSSTHLESLEGSTSEQTEAATMFTTSELKNEADGIKISVEDDTTSANAMTITSSTDHSKSVSSSSLLEGSTTSEKNVAANLSSISETKNEEPHVQLVGPKQKGVEGGAKLTNASTIPSSTHLELASSSQEQDVDVRDSQKSAKTNNDQVSLNDGAFMKVRSIIEEQLPKDDPSPSNVLPLPFRGNPSQNVENLSSPSLVTCELEQLVSKKLLAIENLSLLTDFLVKHPSVLLWDTSLSNRYKGYAYNCLAELLKFLQTHSVLDVLGSSRSEFVELLQDVRKCGFDKDWLDGVEKHALFPDLDFSQDALQKLLDSQQHVTEEVEAINLKLNIFSQHVEDLKHHLTSSEAVLESIIQQKAQVLETKAALSAPLGY